MFKEGFCFVLKVKSGFFKKENLDFNMVRLGEGNQEVTSC